MIELFRYIEHAFPKPPAEDDYIDASGDSSFQNALRDMRSTPNATDQMKKEAEFFLRSNYSNNGSSVSLDDNYRSIYKQVRQGNNLDTEKTKELIEKIFDTRINKVTGLDNVKADKQLLNDGIVAFKLYPEFEKADAGDLVGMRQAIALIESLADEADDTVIDLKKLLLRPVLVPAALLPVRTVNPPPQPGQPADPDPLKQVADIQDEIEELDTARRALLSLQASDFEIKSGNAIGKQRGVQQTADHVSEPRTALRTMTDAVTSRITVSSQAFQQLQTGIRSTLDRFNMQPAETDVPLTVNRIEQKMQELSGKIKPYLFPEPERLYKLGVHLFTARPAIYDKTTIAQSLPAFSAAVTKPLGIGNLQVVKQELIKYEAGEISHIENILEGEKYKRQTERSESIEVTITQEQETINSQERDLQSTERNEMVSESQKEVSKQTSSTKEQTSTTDYGKLVENNKSTYARSITDRVVTSLTEKVREQRIQREQRSYTEKTVHEFDNSAGNRKVRGIYQWVNKRYKNRILNYGKRLLFDVTLPEPGAFLLDSLKKAAQPESLNIYKPSQPAILAKSGTLGSTFVLGGKTGYVYKTLEPQDINSTNYMSLAAQYGVAGAVDTPPNNFVNATAWLSSGPGNAIYKAEKITIEKGYKAISGYFQNTNWMDTNGNYSQNLDGAELYIGQSHFFKLDVLGDSFKMNGETDDVPITFCAGGMQGHTVAVVITSLNDMAMAKWQLKTFATIMEGYRKQLADYEEKLRQIQSTIKAQMLMAQNYAHNPTVERDELKKAFIHLIVSEQFGKAYIPSPDPLQFPPDPKYVNKWGALVSFFERAFEWENMMYVYYPYFWGQQARWAELVLIQDVNPQFEEFLKAGAARVVVPVRPGFEAPIAHFQETGEVWMGKEMPDMFSEQYISIINEINERNFAPGKEKCMAEWEVVLPTSLVMLKADEDLPEWNPSMECTPDA
jgi:hypothetical protein